jgi:hypothetical protein
LPPSPETIAAQNTRMIAQLAVLFLLKIIPVPLSGPAKWFGG